MEPPSYDLTATERALRRERIRRTADVAGRVVSPTMLDIITDMDSPDRWADAIRDMATNNRTGGRA